MGITAEPVCARDEGAGKQSLYNFMFQTAIVSLNAGKTDDAYVLLKRCQEIDPEAAETYFYLADCYRSMGNDSMQVKMIRRAADLRPDNITYKEELVPIYLNAQDLVQASQVLEEIAAIYPERTDILNVLIQIYDHQKDYNKCLGVLNRMETQDGQSEGLTMAKVQTYTKMNREKDALKELQSLVKNHPLDLNYRVMLGNWLLGKGQKKEAVQHYRYVLKEEPTNEGALMSLMDYYRSQGLDSLADQQRYNLLISDNTQQSTKLLLLKMFIRESEQKSADSTVVLNLFDRILAHKQSGTELYEMKFAYMQLKQMPEDSLAVVLHQILDMRPDNAQARFELIRIAWAAGNSEEMVNLAKPALQFNPDEWSFSYFLGVGYFLSDDIQGCIDALRLAEEHIDMAKDKNLAIEMYSLLGDALYKVGKRKEAYEAYENCLRMDPDKVDALNNYAYYLSEDKDADLEKAAAMSLKTIKAQPNNAIYLDTYAWIMYLMGRYEEAKIYMDIATKNLDPEADNTVYHDHMKAIEEKLK